MRRRCSSRGFHGLTLAALASVVGCNEGRASRQASSSMLPTLAQGESIVIEKVAGPIARGDVITFRNPCQPEQEYVKRAIALGGDTIELRCSVVFVNGKAVEARLVDPSCHYDEPDDRGRVTKRPCSRYHETLDHAGYDVLGDPDRPTRRGPDLRDFPERGMPPPHCPGAVSDPGIGSATQPSGRLVETRPEGSPTAPCEPQLHFEVPDGSIFVLGDNRSNSFDSRGFGAVPLGQVTGRIRR